MTTFQMRKLSPVLVVDEIEPCLPFWTDRLGFTKVAEVPEGDALGFVLLAKDGVEIMYQTRESVAKDVPGVARTLRDGAPRTCLYIDVSDVGAVEQALRGLEPIVPRRQTFYGADEIGVREPGGHVVLFAQPAAAAAAG